MMNREKLISSLQDQLYRARRSIISLVTEEAQKIYGAILTVSPYQIQVVGEISPHEKSFSSLRRFPKSFFILQIAPIAHFVRMAHWSFMRVALNFQRGFVVTSSDGVAKAISA